MKGYLLFISVLGILLGLPAPARAQIFGDHYLAGTDGILAGSVPPPGIYFDDINWFGSLDETSGWDSARISSYVNEPRLRWITQERILGANYGVEVMVPWGWQANLLFQPSRLVFLDPHQPDFIPGYNMRYTQYGLHDLEVSPLLLGWHWRRFDLTAGYAFWVPTGDNSFNGAQSNPLDPFLYGPPAQYHWWEHMLTLGATWYPDMDHKWAVGVLNHYEISQSFDSPLGAIQEGQLFSSAWGLSRTLEKYITVGIIGDYSQPATETRIVGSWGEVFYRPAHVQMGPEIQVALPECGFSASLSYLRELNNPDATSDNLNVVTLSLSQRF